MTRRHRQEHVDVFGGQMPPFHRALLLVSQLPQHAAQVKPQVAVQYLPAVLGNPEHSRLVWAKLWVPPIERLRRYGGLRGSRRQRPWNSVESAKLCQSSRQSQGFSKRSYSAFTWAYSPTSIPNASA